MFLAHVLTKPVTNHVLITESTVLLLLQVSSMKQMLHGPQERAPYQLLSSFCWAIFTWDREKILFPVLCYKQRFLKQRRVLET